MTEVDRDRVPEPTVAGDALAGRARDVASAGLVVFPVVTHLYSVVLLLRLRVAGLPVSPRGRKAAREAWRLNLVILATAALCAAAIVIALLARG